MPTLYAALVLLFIICFLFWLIRKNRTNPFTDNSTLPYLRRPLMTPTELAVYAKLLDALPNYMVFAQVQASRVLEVPSSKQTYYWFNFVSRLSYDFVICRLNGIPIAAIEIDDRSHQRTDRQEADNRKNKATESAGVHIIRWQVGAIPSVSEMAKIIKKADRQAAA